MIELTQTILGSPYGNCYGTALACIFHFDPATIPAIPRDDEVIKEKYKGYDEIREGRSAWWWDMWREWFDNNNLKSIRIDAKVFDQYTRHKMAGVYHLMNGPSPRDRERNQVEGRGMMHTVVGRGGLIWWDPHPDRTGLLYVDEIELIVPLDPSKPILGKKYELLGPVSYAV